MPPVRLEITALDGTLLDEVIFLPRKNGYDVINGGEILPNKLYEKKWKDFKMNIRLNAQKHYEKSIVGIEFPKNNMKNQKPKTDYFFGFLNYLTNHIHKSEAITARD